MSSWKRKRKPAVPELTLGVRDDYIYIYTYIFIHYIFIYIFIKNYLRITYILWLVSSWEFPAKVPEQHGKVVSTTISVRNIAGVYFSFAYFHWLDLLHTRAWSFILNFAITTQELLNSTRVSVRFLCENWELYTFAITMENFNILFSQFVSKRSVCEV